MLFLPDKETRLALDTHSEDYRQYLSTLISFRAMILKSSFLGISMLAQWRVQHLHPFLVHPRRHQHQSCLEVSLLSCPQIARGWPLGSLSHPPAVGLDPGGRLWLVCRRLVRECMESLHVANWNSMSIKEILSFSSLYLTPSLKSSCQWNPTAFVLWWLAYATA